MQESHVSSGSKGGKVRIMRPFISNSPYIKQTEGVQKPDFMSMAIRQGLCRPLIAGLADAEGYALDPDDLLAHVIEVATERSICATPRMFPQWLSIEHNYTGWVVYN